MEPNQKKDRYRIDHFWLRLILSLIGIVLLYWYFQFSLDQKHGINHHPKKTPVQYQTSSGHSLIFDQQSLTMAGSSHALNILFVNARPNSLITDASLSENHGSTSPPPFTKVRYHQLWPDIDAVFQADASALVKSSYHLPPGLKGHPVSNIILHYNHPVHLDNQGNLVITFPDGQLVNAKPKAWQDRGGKRYRVEAKYKVLGHNQVGFEAPYEPLYPLVIDLTLTWSSFLGGIGKNFSFFARADGRGHIMARGQTAESWVLAFNGNGDLAVAKFDTPGAMAWTTFVKSVHNGTAPVMDTDENPTRYILGESFLSKEKGL